MAETLVVVPAYNAQEFIRECLQSVTQQTLSDWKLVVVDDGSSDATFEHALAAGRDDPRISVVRQPNARQAVARNRGLSFLTTDTEFVMFLDSDDRLLPDCLFTLRRALLSSPRAVAAYGLPRTVGRDGRVVTRDVRDSYGFSRPRVGGRGLRPTAAGEPTRFENLVARCCIATPGQVLIRRRFVDAAGGFDPETYPNEDWDLWIRLALRGEFVFLDRFVMDKRLHGANTSANGRAMFAAEQVVRRKLATGVPLTAEQRRLARLAHRYSCSEGVAWAGRELKALRLRSGIGGVVRAGRTYLRYLRTPYPGDRRRG